MGNMCNEAAEQRPSSMHWMSKNRSGQTARKDSDFHSESLRKRLMHKEALSVKDKNYSEGCLVLESIGIVDDSSFII